MSFNRFNRGARRTRHAPGVMNKQEGEFAQYLEGLKAAGEVLAWEFEGIKVKLAPRTFLTVDFVVMWKDDTISMIDVKGYVEDDAAVKNKVAYDKYFWWHWEYARKVKGQWEIVPVTGKAT